jgi:hypothetical protein
MACPGTDGGGARLDAFGVVSIGHRNSDDLLVEFLAPAGLRDRIQSNRREG